MKLPLLSLALLCASTGLASATPHPNPFSYPYQTLAEGALEIEQYTDLTPVRVERENADGTLDGVFSLRSQLTTEVEYGLTDRLEAGFYFAFRQSASPNTPVLSFAGIKQRLRYRFADTGELPIDIGLYLELAEYHDELEFEEKLLLSKSFGALNVVANLWVEQEWYFQTKDTKYIYNPTVGINYELSPRYIIGAEYWARGRFDSVATTDTSNGDAPTGTHHYVGPNFLYQRDKISFALGVYARLDGIGKSAVVNDPYGKLWVRAIVAVDL